jgi:hypothetical protein
VNYVLRLRSVLLDRGDTLRIMKAYSIVPVPSQSREAFSVAVLEGGVPGRLLPLRFETRAEAEKAIADLEKYDARSNTR